MNKQSLLNVLLAMALTGGCAHAPVAVPLSVEVHEPLPGLYTAGQPAPTDWGAIRALGVRTVIDLRTASERPGRDEAQEVHAAGLRYQAIPIGGAADLTPANVRALHLALAAHHKVLVHCASGNRAGALLALEQAEFHAVPPTQALVLGKAAGLTHLEAPVQQQLERLHQAQQEE